MDNSTKIAGLDSRLSLPGKAQIVAGNGGLPKIQIETQAAKAEIYLHGAQITSWQPAGMGEVLFLSTKSNWQDGKAIRGGIPVCFPWFRAKADNPQAPSYGFVRTREWQLESVSADAEDGVCARFSTESDEGSRRWWPFDFRLEYSIAAGKSLKLELAMTNTGDKDLRFEEALHTYFRVGDVRRVHVTGLEKVSYLDNRDGNRQKEQQGDLDLARQTDNAYRNATGQVEIFDPVLRRRLITRKENSASTIVWNPWSDGAAALVDLGSVEWQTMLCVEGGNILDSAVVVARGESHSMRVGIDVIA